MAIQTAAGAELYVSKTVPNAFTATGYGAVFTGATLVGEVTNIGEFGKQFELVSHDSLARRGTAKLKGQYNNGSLSPTVALDPDDDGQDIMLELLDDDGAGTFFVKLSDGTVYGFMGLVMTFRPSVGEANSVVTAACTIEIDREDVVRFTPTP